MSEPTIEERATAMGWQPKESFKGDPARWTDAPTLVTAQLQAEWSCLANPILIFMEKCSTFRKSSWIYSAEINNSNC